MATGNRDHRSHVEAHHRRRFERLVGLAMRRLPAGFAGYLDNVAILTADEPSEQQLQQSGPDGDEQLFGLYEGVPLSERGSHYGMVLPDRITLFRRTFESACATESDLIEEIRRTILHEVGHHRGWDEERLKDV